LSHPESVQKPRVLLTVTVQREGVLRQLQHQSQHKQPPVLQQKQHQMQQRTQQLRQ
jgi:hypothetical protein